MINWTKVDEEIRKCDYKYALIFKFFNLMEFFDDKTASILLRLIVRNNMDIFINYHFYTLCKYIPKERYPETIDFIISFYDLVKEKIKITLLLSKWYIAYKNEDFWNKEINNQIEDLIFLKHYIQALNDTSFGGISFGIKLLPILESNKNNSKEEAINTAIERLGLTYQKLGESFFKLAKIPIMTIDEFRNLSNEEIVRYVNLVHLKTIEIISQTIDFFEKYLMINLKIDNLLNPFYVNIVEDTTMPDDIEDLSVLF